MKVVAQVADVTKSLALVMVMVDRRNLVIFNKHGGYMQTMKKEEESKMRKLMSASKGARVPIQREGDNFAAEIKIEKKEDEYHVPKKVAAKKVEQQQERGRRGGQTQAEELE